MSDTGKGAELPCLMSDLLEGMELTTEDAPEGVSKLAAPQLPAPGPPKREMVKGDRWAQIDLEQAWPEYANGKPLRPRHRRVAQMVAQGCRYKDITDELGYTPAWISTLLTWPSIRAEVIRLQERIFEKTLDDRMQALGPSAMDVAEQILHDPNIDPLQKEKTAKWVIEKLTGKPAQQVEHSGALTLGVLIDRIETLKEARPVGPTLPAVARSAQITEQVPKEEQSEEAKRRSRLTNWISDNLD